MIEIHVKTIPHKRQRYDTVGDWTEGIAPDGHGPEWHITVSQLGDWRMEVCLALHELAEAALCRHAGITQQQVDSFDFSSQAEEPGEELSAPYYKQHFVASILERLLMTFLDLDWDEYSQRCRKPVSVLSRSKATEPVSPSG